MEQSWNKSGFEENEVNWSTAFLIMSFHRDGTIGVPAIVYISQSAVAAKLG